MHDLDPFQCFKRSLPDTCLLISVAPEEFAHLRYKFRATEEHSILNLRLPVRLPLSRGCRLPQLLTKRLLELAWRAWTEERQDGSGAKPGGCCSGSGEESVGAPMVLFQSIHPTPRQLRCDFVCGDVASVVSAQGGNPYRIQMNVTVDLQRFCWFVEDGFETSLKQCSDSTVFWIEPHTVADIKPMERLGSSLGIPVGDGSGYPSRRNRAA